LIRACRRPRLAEWTNPERSFAENEDWTEELQGLVTDGHHWYASCNANDEREGIYRLDMDFGNAVRREHPWDPNYVHLGACSVRNGKVYVPLQGAKWGVWVVETDVELTPQAILEAADADRPEDDLFAWCDVNPHNGLIYTCNFDMPSRLYAYEDYQGVFMRRKAHDIRLVQPNDGLPTTSVQSGCFTPNHKWICVCDVDAQERIHCHSTLNGAFLGRRELLAETDEGPLERNELEGIWYAPIHTGEGHYVQVHVLELNNEVFSTDDMYLWHFSLPEHDAL